MAHRKWKEIKQQPGTAGPGNMLGCYLLSFHFLWAIHPIRPVNWQNGRAVTGSPEPSQAAQNGAYSNWLKYFCNTLWLNFNFQLTTFQAEKLPCRKAEHDDQMNDPSCRNCLVAWDWEDQ